MNEIFRKHPWFHATGLSAGATIPLDPDEAHHLRSVLRLAVDDEITLVDGKGNLSLGRVGEVGKSRVTVKCGQVETLATSFGTSLAFGITKGPAMEVIFRKCTEIGIARFQPLVTAHSLSIDKWNADRWAKVVAEAGKQSQSAVFPVVEAPIPLATFLKKKESLIFCNETDRHSSLALDKSEPPHWILIGPEGGWNAEEKTQMNQAGARSLGLGENRLRAETACLVALTLVKQALGEFRR